MRLEGSCECGKVRFRVESETPAPGAEATMSLVVAR